MPKIIISGCSGRMGQVVSRMCSEREDMEVVAGFNRNNIKMDYPVYSDPMEFLGHADVLIDFSSPLALEKLLSYCKRRKIPVVICTTGYNENQLNLITEASEYIPIFKSANMSLGINLMANLLKKAASVLGNNFDVEIVERHHKGKIDAPSGTALMLADSIASSLPHPSEYVYERQSVRQPRGHNEIGISAVRGGTFIGEHDVIFAGSDEVLEISHKAYTRDVFANGALIAAKFLTNVSKPGMYDMNDALAEILED